MLDGTLTEVKSRFGKNSIQINIEGDGKFIKQLPGVKSFTEYNNYIEIKIDENSDTNQILKSVADKVMVKRFEIVEPSLYEIFNKIMRPFRETAQLHRHQPGPEKVVIVICDTLIDKCLNVATYLCRFGQRS